MLAIKHITNPMPAEAFKWAYQLHDAGIQIVRILGSEGQVVTVDELLAWRRGERLGK